MQPMQEMVKFTQSNKLPGGLKAARDNLRRIRGERDQARDDYKRAVDDARQRNESRPTKAMETAKARLEIAEQRVGRARVELQSACAQSQAELDARAREFRRVEEANLLPVIRELAMAEAAESAIHTWAIANGLSLSLSPVFDGSVNYARLLERLERDQSQGQRDGK